MNRPEPLYRPSGFFLLRAPTLPVEVFRDLTDPYGSNVRTSIDTRSSTARERGHDQLAQLARNPRVRQAVTVASASLGGQLERWDSSRPVADDRRGQKKRDRALSSLLRYVIRMSTRPTPYGLFAAVAMGRLDDDAGLALAADPVAATRTRADLGWVLALAESTAASQRTRLDLQRNDLIYRVGDRALLPTPDLYGRQDERRVDFRAAGLVGDLLDAARRPTSWPHLVDLARAAVPDATTEQIDGLLDQLVGLHALVPGLRPRLSQPRPELELADRLRGVPGGEPLAAALETVHARFRTVDEAGGSAPVAALADLETTQRRLTPDYAHETYQLDTRLAIEGDALPQAVGETAAEAAELLLRLGQPDRLPHLQSYHEAFLERYGLNAEVPVLELVSAELGLDAPTGYTAPTRSCPLPPAPGPDHDEHDPGTSMRMALVAEALAQQRSEIELSDEVVEAMTRWRPGDHAAAAPPSLDVYAQIGAPSVAAMARGDFFLAVTPGLTCPGGRSTGRFADLLESAAPDLRDLAAAEAALQPAVMVAELSFVPPHGRSANVTVRPDVHDYEITVNAEPSLGADAQLDLADIVVGASAERFYLRSRRHDRELVVTQTHMLSEINAPNPLRFLLEVSRDGAAPWPGFDWGPVGNVPYLPRLRRGRIVLHPAQWSLSAGLLPDGRPGGDLPTAEKFHEAVAQWRTRWRVPRWVYLCFLDNRLLLDLDQPLCTDELYGELRRATATEPRARVVLQEMLPDFSQLWLRDPDGRPHVSEVVLSVVARNPDHVRRAAVELNPVDSPVHRSDRRRGVGSDWLHLQLYVAADRQVDLLLDQLSPLVDALSGAGLSDRWFFIRYADPRPHLRLRLHVPDPATAPLVTAQVTAWAEQVIAAGLADDTRISSYDRELERYGGPEAIEWIEEAFEANSRMVIALLEVIRRTGIDPVVAGIVALHRSCEHWGLDPMSGVRTDEPVEFDDDVHTAFRSRQKLLGDLLVPWPAHPDAEAAVVRAELEAAIAVQQDVLAVTGERIRKLAEVGRLWGSEQSILTSFLHMLTNRLYGIDLMRETSSHQLWSLARRSIRRRPVEAGRR